MNYFITGATGFIGMSLCKQLIEKGHKVKALVRDPSKAESLKKLGVYLFKGDITNKESMREPMTNTDGIFHLAALYKLGIKDKKRAEQINVGGTKNVLEVMKELKIKKGVYTSTLAVFSDTKGELVDETYFFKGKHLTVYDRTKWQAHYEIAKPLMEQGLPLVIVLPGVVYGPGDTSSMGDAFRDYLQGTFPMLPKKTMFCWAHVDDISKGHILAMEKGTPGESYIIAGPPHTVEEAFEIAEKISGIKAPKRRVSPWILKMLSGIMKILEVFIKQSQMYSSEELRTMAGVTYLGSNQRAKERLGYEIRSLEEGLRDTIPVFMKELNIPLRQ